MNAIIYKTVLQNENDMKKLKNRQSFQLVCKNVSAVLSSESFRRNHRHWLNIRITRVLLKETQHKVRFTVEQKRALQTFPESENKRIKNAKQQELFQTHIIKSFTEKLKTEFCLSDSENKNSSTSGLTI